VLDQLTGLDIFSPLTMALRLISAMLAGLLIGIERERHYQAAGLRTHMVLCLGASLVMLISIYLPFTFIKDHPTSDPGRLAAQVISGIGFLGAGAIFRYGFNVKGLTTAASIWTTSAIGLAFGAGFYVLGLMSTVLLVVVLQVFEIVEDRLFEHKDVRVLTVIINSQKLSPKRVIDTVKSCDLKIRQVAITERVEEGTAEIVFNCRMVEDFSIRTLFEKIKEMGNIKTLRID
jgi:putative Mg2+ transporter-C (MgtC) family protein